MLIDGERMEAISDGSYLQRNKGKVVDSKGTQIIVTPVENWPEGCYSYMNAKEMVWYVIKYPIVSC